MLFVAKVGRVGRVVRHGSAKPATPVRIRYAPPINCWAGGGTGIHDGLKIRCLSACGFKSRPAHQYESPSSICLFIILLNKRIIIKIIKEDIRMMGIWIILAIVVVVAVLLWTTYNGLVRLKIKTDEALSDIIVQMKRRLDLIPNIINTVKGYAKHEKETLENVTKARTAAMEVSSGDIHNQAEADNMLSSTLKSLFAVTENYPDLKANEGFLQLQAQLTTSEDKIQASRRFYNGNVRDFNTKLDVFPTNFIGNMLGFKVREFFEVAESEKEAVAKAPEDKF